MMKGKCATYRDAIVELAHGVAHEEAQAHVESCPRCAAVLADLTKAVTGLRSSFYDAPTDLVFQAKSIFPAPIQVPARRIGLTLANAGARGGSALQAAYEFEGGSVRVQYEELPEGWQVMARVDAPGWETLPVAADDAGRLEFVVSDLTEARVVLVRDGREVTIEAPSEADREP